MLCLDCAWTGKVCEPNDNGVHSSVLRIYVIMYVCVCHFSILLCIYRALLRVGAPDCLVGMSDLKQPPKSLFLQFFTVNAKYYGEREGTIRSKISLLINPVKCKAADCLRSEFFVLLEFAWPITSCVGDDPS